MSEPVDPGPAPASLVVRAQGEGFYARLYPRPAPSPLQLTGVVLGFGAAGLGLALLFAESTSMAVQITAAILLFGVLLSSFVWFSGWFPVEVVVDDTVVNWNSERIPMALVRDCVAREGTVELLGEAGRPLAVVHHLQPDAARWLSLAIRASLPAERALPLSEATTPSG